MDVTAIRPTYQETAIMAQNVQEYEDWYFQFYNLAKMHQSGYTGRGVNVGVLDTGVPRHDDIDIYCEEDMRRGYDPTHVNKYDRDGHSTHVCGIISAQHNGYGTKGVAPDCNLHVAKVLGDDGNGTLSDIIRGGDRMAELGVTICNMSLGFNGYMPTDLDNAIKRWHNQGMFIVAASGNDGQNNHLDNPSKHPLVLAIGSHDKLGRRSDFSDSGNQFMIYGAGDKVLSTYKSNQYQVLSGTSMAAPFITALISCYRDILMSKYGSLTVPMFHDLVSGKITA